MRQLLFYILLSSLSFACDKELNIHVPFEGEKLVISCLISTDNPVDVAVTKTRDPYVKIHRKNSYITDANILFFENGTSVGTFHYDTNEHSFRSDYIPKFGANYHLTVDAPGFESVTSESITIPEKRQIIVESSERVSIGPGNDTIYTGSGIAIQVNFSNASTVKIHFSDPGEEDNFYAYKSNVSIKFGGGSGSTLTGIYQEGCNFSSLGAYSSGYVFDDYCFNGLETNVEITYTYSSGDPIVNVQFYGLDKYAYEYERNLGLYLQSQYGTEFSLDPIRVPSSFENAYGVFGAYNYSDTTIAL